MDEDEDPEIAAALAELAGQDAAAADDARAGEPPDEHDVRWALHATSNLCRALGLLATGGDWRERSYGLTGTGRATALEALRARATGPRTIPWP